MKYSHRNSNKTLFPRGLTPWASAAVIPTLACPKAEVNGTRKHPLNQQCFPPAYNPGIKLYHPPRPAAFSPGGGEEGVGSPSPNSCRL